MKNILLLNLFLLGFAGLQAQNGIAFAEGDWESILAKAKTQDKIIFMDAYATWCGPCKVMSREVFTDQAVGEYYNDQFINVKIDMEKGEGLELAQQYQVRAYPTLLFINGDGQVVHRTAGGMDAADFIKLGETALDPAANLLGLEKQYKTGTRTPELLRDLALARYQAMDNSYGELAEAYIATQKEVTSLENLTFLFKTTDGINSPLFDLMVKHRAELEDLFGKEQVAGRIQQLVTQELYAGPNDESALEEADRLFKKAYPDQAPKLSANFRMNYYRRVGDMDQYAQTAVDYFKAYPSNNANELNNVAWVFFESVEDKAMLEEALGWAKKSVALEERYYNNDTLAWLYFKLGEKRKAKKTAKEAIKIAQLLDEDYSSTQELLDQL